MIDQPAAQGDAVPDPPSPNVDPPARRFAPLSGWLLVAGLIAIEFLLFRHFLLREVVWAYSPDFDQAAYLRQAYELYEQIRAAGLWRGLAHQPQAPQGAFLQLQAALLFTLLGHASRFIALSLNFFYFATFQIALLGSLRWLTRRWSLAFVGVGLLLAAGTTFNTSGGIYDFRMDFIAFCLYGTFLCAVIRSRVFSLAGWSLAAGLCGTLLICFRFITASYLAAVLGIMVVLTAAQLIRGNPEPRREAYRRLRGILLAGGVLVILAGPILWSRRAAIHDYYVVNHVTGAEKEVRAAETGTTHLRDAIVYYPTNLSRVHAGALFFIPVVAMFLLAVFLAMRAKSATNEVAIQVHSPPFPLRLALVFVTASLLIPLAILTSDVSKSPVVGGILVAPLLWIVMLGIVGLTKTSRQKEFRRSIETAFVVAAVLVVVFGLTVQARKYSQSRWMSHHRRGVENVTALCDLIASHAKAAGWSDIAVFNDSVADYLNVQNIEVLTYERHGYILQAGDQFSSVLEVPQQQVFDLLAGSHFAILSHRVWPPPAYDYPIDLELERLHPQLEAICRREMTQIGHYRIFDREIEVFMRR
jgi:hypothetical protein